MRRAHCIICSREGHMGSHFSRWCMHSQWESMQEFLSFNQQLGVAMMKGAAALSELHRKYHPRPRYLPKIIDPARARWLETRKHNHPRYEVEYDGIWAVLMCLRNVRCSGWKSVREFSAREAREIAARMPYSRAVVAMRVIDRVCEKAGL